MKRLRTILVALLLLGSTASANADNAGETILQTSAGPIQLHIIHHASFVLQWNKVTIYVDPTGDAAQYQGLGAPDLILITHAHGDHLDPKILAAIDTSKATVVMPQSVADKIGKRFGAAQSIMANGDNTSIDGVSIHAMPMYNLPESPDSYHPKGWGNGYVLSLGGKRVYISGDTGGIPEMRALTDIDAAFVCMNLPWTMDVEHAANAVLAFKPRIVYPYHYRGQDTTKFKHLVNAAGPAIEVRLRDWYAH
ncbi:MAG: MBL fold metallo-hydrolase [Rhodanobacteraceae bacterium]